MKFNSFSQSSLVLRIGVVQNGRILEERLVRGGAVTIGTSKRATIVVPAGYVSEAYRLFERRGGTYHLNFTDEMEGRLGVEEGVADLSALREQGVAQARRGGYSLALPKGARGKIVMDDLTLLFQFVPAPPATALQLPRHMRRRLGSSLDRPFMSSLGAAAIVQLGLVAHLLSVPVVQTPTGLSDLEQRWVRVLTPKAAPVRLAPPPPTPRPVTPTKIAQAIPKAKRPPKPTKAPPAKALVALDPIVKAAPDTGLVSRKRVTERTILGLIGGHGANGAGDAFDLGGNVVSASMKVAFSGMPGVELASNDTKRPTRRGHHRVSGPVATIRPGHMAKGPRHAVRHAAKVEAKIRTRIVTPRPPEPIGGDLTAAQISKAVKRRLRSVKSCYERELRKSPDTRGKVVIEFVVSPSGRISRSRVVSNSTRSDTLGRCIAGSMKRLRFRNPGGEVTARFPFVLSRGQ